MSVSKPELVLVVPVNEHFVTVSSPEDVKTRLSQPRSPVKPTKEEQAAYEERHALLAALHVDAIKRKAARENERAAEALRRVRRQEAADKQRLQERQQADEKRAAEKREALEAEASEKRARREALKEAFFASRASMQTAAQNRAIERMERLGQAEAKRSKMMQATVHKSAYEVKHAIAVATAAKEKAKEEAIMAREQLQGRLAAASSRREMYMQEKASPPSPTRSPTGSGVDLRFGRPLMDKQSRARQVAQCLNDEAVALELKRQRLSRAMETALSRRAEKIEAKRQRAAAYKERAQSAFEARRAASEDAIRELRHQHVVKEQAAEVASQLHLRARAGRKGRSFALDIALEKSGVAPPAALVARLSVRPLKDVKIAALAAAAAERHVRAAARVEQLRANKLAALKAQLARSDAATGRRVLALRVAQAKMEAKAKASAVVLAAARIERASIARKMNKRVEVAGMKRAAARLEQLKALEALVDRRAAADKKRAARLTKPTTLQGRSLLFSAARAALARGVLERGAAADKKQAAAAERRQASLSARVAKAKMSGVLRITAVKFTLVAQAGSELPLVQVQFVLPGEASGQVKKAAAAAGGQTKALEEKPVEKKANVFQRFRKLLPF